MFLALFVPVPGATCGKGGGGGVLPESTGEALPRAGNAATPAGRLDAVPASREVARG
ncbi:MAG: hypothetical protein ACT4PV_15685 [Planctomycetaceae bacterium]